MAKPRFTCSFISIYSLLSVSLVVTWAIFTYYVIKIKFTIYTILYLLVLAILLQNALLSIFGRLEVDIIKNILLVKSGIPPLNKSWNIPLESIKTVCEKKIWFQTLYQISDKVIVIQGRKKVILGRMLTAKKRKKAFKEIYKILKEANEIKARNGL